MDVKGSNHEQSSLVGEESKRRGPWVVHVAFQVVRPSTQTRSFVSDSPLRRDHDLHGANSRPLALQLAPEQRCRDNTCCKKNRLRMHENAEC